MLLGRRHLPIALAALAALAIHGILASTGTTYYMTQAIMSACYALVVIGLCLLMGYAGQASLGHAAFFAIGGYASAFLTTCDIRPWTGAGPVKAARALGLLTERCDLYGAATLSLHPWAAAASAMGLAALAALIIGPPVIRLKGHYMAMATLGFGLIVYRLVIGSDHLGQADGITGVPPLPILPGMAIDGRPESRIVSYYAVWAAVLLAMVLAVNLVRSRTGRALRSIHENEEAAHSLGVDTARAKLSVFILSAILAAAGGILLTHFNGGIGPGEASVIKSIRYVAIVAVGGMSSLWGGLIIGLVLNFLSLRGVFGTFDDAVFGAILIAILIFAPRGILALPRIQRLRAAFSKSPMSSRKPHE